MSTKENYEAKIGVITAIPTDRIKQPVSIPVKVYVQEAENLLKWCLEDEAILKAKGMPWDLVIDLPVRIGALREAESKWGGERFKKEEPETQWMDKSPVAYTLRNELLQELRFAYRKDPELSAAIKNISSGYGYASMIQDLYKLGTLGRNHPGPLERMGFDMTQLDRAVVMVDELTSLYAATKRDRGHFGDARTIRNQAFTHLKEAVDEIRNYGRHIFRNNEARKKGYRSEYLNRRYRNRIKKASLPAVDDAASEIP